MSIFTKLAQLIFAPVDENGDTRSVSNQDAQVWGTEIERVVSLFVLSGGLIYASLSNLNADLAHDANSMAWVIDGLDSGVYGKVGASGVGSWTRRGDLPYGFIIATDAGAGTPNAMQATTAVPVSGSALIWMNIADTNGPGPTTVQFNGAGPAYTIKTNSGNDPAEGGLVAGMIVAGILSGSTFRLLSDQVSSAVLAAAEGFANIAQAAANGNLVFVTRSAAESADIDDAIHSVSLKGDAQEGDGLGGLFVDEDAAGEHAWRNTVMSGGITSRAWYAAGDIVQPEVVNIPSDVPDLVTLFGYLKKRRVFSSLTVNLEAGVLLCDQPIDPSHPDAANITVIGADPLTANVTPTSVPSVSSSALSIGGQVGRYYYDITFAVDDADGFDVGDWVAADIVGAAVSAASRSLASDGIRAWELSGAHQVSAVSEGSVTLRNRSRTDLTHFPTGALIKVASGKLRKIASVLLCSGSGDITPTGISPVFCNVAIVHDDGGDSGSTINGIYVDARASGGGTPISFSMRCVIISGFGGTGIAAFGAGAFITGDEVYISDTGTHGAAAYLGAKADFARSVASGCGSPSGAGFIGTQGGVITAPGCKAFHCRDAGFLSNRAGTSVCRDSMSSGHGNETDMVANGGGVLTEGKGYEAESASTMEATGSVSLFCLLYGFYNNTASKMFAEQCLTGGYIMSNGAGFLQRGAGSLSAGLSTALGIGSGVGSNRGFYANGGEINARNTWAQDHQLDYAAQSGGKIMVHDYLNISSTFGPALNYLGASGSLITNRLTFDAGLDLRGANMTRGDVVISGGTFTRSRNYHSVDTESGGSADDLDTILGGSDGDFLIIKSVSISRVITVKHGTGNIRLQGGADRVLNNPRDMLFLFYVASVSAWCEVAFSTNN